MKISTDIITRLNSWKIPRSGSTIMNHSAKCIKCKSEVDLHPRECMSTSLTFKKLNSFCRSKILCQKLILRFHKLRYFMKSQKSLKSTI